MNDKTVYVKQVTTRKELRKFVDFPLKLYKGCKSYVPGIYLDELDTFDPKKNPVYEFCTSAQFLAYKDGKVVGRVAAIINNKANASWNHNEVRYGWFDFIDDREVSKALIDAVIAYGKQHAMNTVTGPLGFLDFDPEGMLVEGFEHISTTSLRHNHPYYKDHMEAMGFKKEVDWLEYKVYVPEKVPEKYTHMAKLIAERYKLHVRKLTKKDVFGPAKMGVKLFKIINETYSKLYNFTVLSDALVEKFVGDYMRFIDLDYVALVENEQNELVGVGIAMPSFSRALQKCDGKFFPFGWYHILRSIFGKVEESFELLLIGVTEEYRNKGVHALIFNEIMPNAIRDGFKWAETNAELETNTNINALWTGFDLEQTKRRRIYTKEIE